MHGVLIAKGRPALDAIWQKESWSAKSTFCWAVVAELWKVKLTEGEVQHVAQKWAKMSRDSYCFMPHRAGVEKN